MKIEKLGNLLAENLVDGVFATAGDGIGWPCGPGRDRLDQQNGHVRAHEIPRRRLVEDRILHFVKGRKGNVAEIVALQFGDALAFGRRGIFGVNNGENENGDAQKAQEAGGHAEIKFKPSKHVSLHELLADAALQNAEDKNNRYRRSDVGENVAKNRREIRVANQETAQQWVRERRPHDDSNPLANI